MNTLDHIQLGYFIYVYIHTQIYVYGCVWVCKYKYIWKYVCVWVLIVGCYQRKTCTKVLMAATLVGEWVSGIVVCLSVCLLVVHFVACWSISPSLCRAQSRSSVSQSVRQPTSHIVVWWLIVCAVVAVAVLISFRTWTQIEICASALRLLKTRKDFSNTKQPLWVLSYDNYWHSQRAANTAII